MYIPSLTHASHPTKLSPRQMDYVRRVAGRLIGVLHGQCPGEYEEP